MTESARQKVAQSACLMVVCSPASRHVLGPQEDRLQPHADITLSVRMGLSARRPPPEVVDELKGLLDIGVTHVIVETRVTALDDMTALLDRFTNDVRSKL